MARPRSNKPYFHEASGYWCTSVNRKRVYLDKDYKVACRKLRELREKQVRESQAGKSWLDEPFPTLVDEFLDDIKARRKAGTYTGYRYRLLRAMKILGTNLRVGDVTRLHLAKIEQKLTPDYSPTTVKDTIDTVQFVFGWAVRHDLLSSNPLAGYEKPRPRVRSRIVEPAEFQAILREADAAFRRFLIAIRMTGCRPIEIRSLVWEWVDLENGLWIFPDHKSITQQRQPRPRIVPIPQPIWNLCRALSNEQHQPTDHVFLNNHGKPYAKDCCCQKMDRIRKRAGIKLKAGEQLVLYSNRHTFATERSGRITDLELAELLGQTDTRTTKRYVHFNADRLRDIRRRSDEEK